VVIFDWKLVFLNMKTLLKTHFGYDEFRPLQEKIVNAVLEKRDCFVLMPTGGGKSLCYQLPALAFEGLTLVISPLIALMKDQVDALKVNGIEAEFINSSLSGFEILNIKKKIFDNKIKLLYIAPERLAVNEFQDFLREIKVSLIAVDEAHCISVWGHDFRVEYRNLKVLKKIFPGTPIIALTATATKKVRDDIISQLELSEPLIFNSSFDRENLKFEIFKKKNAFDKLVRLVQKYKGKSVIIYCFSRKETENIANSLKEEGFKALAYHAGLTNEDRKKNQELFIRDEVDIIVATIAFGMGIDKPDVRLIVHYTFPKTLEGYYQEVGRAGRDSLESDCVMFYSYGDARKHEVFLREINDQAFKAAAYKKLKQVIDYCESRICRRKYLLNYFGEIYEKDNCQGCDICLREREMFDATSISQKILSAIIRTGNRFGGNYIVDVLKGRNKAIIRERGHNNLSVFGIVKDFFDDDLKEIIRSLIINGLIIKNEGEYPTLSVSNKGISFLKSKEILELVKPKDEMETSKSFVVKIKEETFKFDLNLFEILRKKRKEIADANNVPPFIIFSDVTLREMAYFMPINKEHLAKIKGVGVQKLEDLGDIFLEIIQKYVNENSLVPMEMSDRKAKSLKKIKTVNRYEPTMLMLKEKLEIHEIARKQGFKNETIISHIEKLIEREEKIDIAYLKPEFSEFNEINEAFKECGDQYLGPVYAFLKGKYGYDRIRLVRIFRRMGAG